MASSITVAGRPYQYEAEAEAGTWLTGRADVDVLPWHAINSFSTRRVRVARQRLVAA